MIRFDKIHFTFDPHRENICPSGLTLAPRVVDHEPAILVPQRITAFRTWMENQDIGNLADKVLANIRYISWENTLQALALLALRINNFTMGEPYGFITWANWKSGQYMYEHTPLDPSPSQIVYCYDDNRKAIAQAASPLLPRYVYLEDGAYSAGQMGTVLHDFVSATGIRPEQVMIALVATTNFAKERMQKAGFFDYNAVYYIPEGQELFSPRELASLTKASAWAGAYEDAVLTFFSHKVPDNFFGMLRRRVGEYDDQNNQVYLLDDSADGPLWPPYRQKR